MAVGGNPQSISRELRRLGFESRTLVLEGTYFGFDEGEAIWQPGVGRVAKEWKRFRALRYAFNTDVAFLNFGRTLYRPLTWRDDGRSATERQGRRMMNLYATVMQHIELGVLRWRAVPIFLMYQGDDARQGDYSLAHFQTSIAGQHIPGYYTPESDDLKRRQIRLLASAALRTYALNPDLLRVLPPDAEFLPYAHIDLSQWTEVPSPSRSEGAPLVIGHAPSHRAVKGSDVVIDAVDALRRSGVDIELVLLEGLNHSAMKEALASVHILVDQLFAGWYGGVAVEAMALGRPVMCYLREEDLDLLPRDLRAEIPIVPTSAESLAADLARMAAMPSHELEAIGRWSRRYVERWHNPPVIAERIALDIREALGMVSA